MDTSVFDFTFCCLCHSFSNRFVDVIVECTPHLEKILCICELDDFIECHSLVLFVLHHNELVNLMRHTQVQELYFLLNAENPLENTAF